MSVFFRFSVWRMTKIFKFCIAKNERPGYLSREDYAFMRKIKKKEEKQKKLNARIITKNVLLLSTNLSYIFLFMPLFLIFISH